MVAAERQIGKIIHLAIEPPPQPPGVPNDLVLQIQVITNTLLFAVGIIAVIMLIIGGIKYIISSGEPKNIESAKNTILYAIIGIVVAILAYAIVNFVIGLFN